MIIPYNTCFRTLLTFIAALLFILSEANAGTWTRGAMVSDYHEDMSNWPVVASSYVSDVRPLPDGSGFALCVADSPYRINIYSAATRSYSTLRETPNQWFLRLSPDLSVGAGMGRRNNEIEIWSIEQGVKITTFSIGDSTNFVVQLQFSADSKNIIALYGNFNSSSTQYYTAVHEIATGTLLQTVPLLPSHTLTSLVKALFLSGDGSMVGGYSYNQATDEYFAEAWHTATGEQVVYPISQPAHSSLSPVEKLYRPTLSFQFYGYITQSGQPVLLNLASGISRTIPFSGRATYIAFQDNGRLLAVAGTETSPQLVLFDTETLTRKTSFPISDYPITGVSVLPDGSMAAIAHVSIQTCEGPNGIDNYEYNTLALYESTTGTIVKTLPQDGHMNTIQAVAWSPDGLTVASTGEDKYTLWYEAATGKSLGRWYGTGVLAFTQDGRSLLRASAGLLDNINLATAQVTRIASLPLTNIERFIRSSDGSQFALSGADTILLMRYPDMQQRIIAIPGGMKLLSTALTNNAITGILVPAITTDSFSICTWNSSGALVSQNTYVNPDGIISQAELSPDNRYVVLSSGKQGRITRTNGETIRTFTVRTGWKWESEFSTDGEQLLVSYASFLSTEYITLQCVQRYWTGEHRVDDTLTTIVKPSFSTMMGLLTVSPKADAFLFTPVKSCGIGTLYCRDIPEPSLWLSSRSLNFGDVYAGISSVQTLTLTNDSEAPVVIEELTIPAPHQPKLFTLQYNTSLPDTLYRGDSRSVNITCTPSANVQIDMRGQIGTLQIKYDETAPHTVTIPFTGSITSPLMSKSADTLDFGDVKVGTTEKRTVVIKSLNPAPLYISSIDTYFPLADKDFSATVDQHTPITLARGEELTVTVYCHPSRTIETSSYLSISSNEINTTRNIYVVARGIWTVGVDDYPAPHNEELHILPNPISSTALIHYTMSRPGLARIELFSVDGTLLYTLANEQREVGSFSVEFTSEILSSGVYYCRMTTAAGTITKPVLIVH